MKVKDPSLGVKSGESVGRKLYECNECMDKGFKLRKVPDLKEDGITQNTWPNGELMFIETLIDCQCYKKRQSEHLMMSSEITEDFMKIGFSNFILEGKHELVNEAYQCAMDYYKEFTRIQNNRCNSISLLGQPGAGKTHLLTAVANNLIQKRQVSVQYFPFVEGFSDLKDDWDLLNRKLYRMKRVDVLFIDDLFKGRDFPTPFQLENTFEVINYRYLNYKPIMISSEKTVDELCDIDEALGTRIYEMSKEFTVVIKGDRKVLNHRLEGLQNV
jgi:DNA replication protein DnaC